MSRLECTNCGLVIPMPYAAGPDLLVALEELVECHARYCSEYGPGIDDALAVCLKPARAAIAKARGER